MSDRDVVDLSKSRDLRTNITNTVGRKLLHRPVSTDSYPVQGSYVKEAGEMMEESDGDYEPAIVKLKEYTGDDRDSWPTLAFVNREEPDDVIIVCPMDGEAMDR